MKKIWHKFLAAALVISASMIVTRATVVTAGEDEYYVIADILECLDGQQCVPLFDIVACFSNRANAQDYATIYNANYHAAAHVVPYKAAVVQYNAGVVRRSPETLACLK